MKKLIDWIVRHTSSFWSSGETLNNYDIIQALKRRQEREVHNR